MNFFKKVSETIPIPERDIDLYMNWEKLLENLNWRNELRSKFIKVYSATIKIINSKDNDYFLPSYEFYFLPWNEFQYKFQFQYQKQYSESPTKMNI